MTKKQSLSYIPGIGAIPTTEGSSRRARDRSNSLKLSLYKRLLSSSLMANDSRSFHRHSSTHMDDNSCSEGSSSEFSWNEPRVPSIASIGSVPASTTNNYSSERESGGQGMSFIGHRSMPSYLSSVRKGRVSESQPTMESVTEETLSNIGLF